MATVDISGIYIYNYNKSSENIEGIAPGENTEISYSFKNNSVKTIKEVKICLVCPINNTNYYASEYCYLSSQIPPNGTGYGTIYHLVSLKRGEKCTLGSNVFDYMNLTNPVTRAIPIKCRMVFIFSDYSTFDSGIISVGNSAYAINARINPKISYFIFDRCDTNGNKTSTGERVLTTIKTDFLSSTYYYLFNLSIGIYKKGESSPIQTINVSDSQTLLEFSNGIKNSTKYINSIVLNKDIEYEIYVTISDNYEFSNYYYNVINNFANVHLSAASHGGVALGMFSTSTDSIAKFECNYPSFFKQLVTIESSNNSVLCLTATGKIKAASLELDLSIDAPIGDFDSLSTGNLEATGNVTTKGFFATDFLTSMGETNLNGTTKLNGDTIIGDSSSDVLRMNASLAWTDLTCYVTTPNENKYGGGKLRYAKLGEHVFIKGSIQAKPDTLDVLVGTLPAGYRPSEGNRYFLKACSGGRVARFYVNSVGQLILEWVRNLSDGDKYTTSLWIDCNIDFWI